MTSINDNREVIPAGEQPFWTWDHLIPIAKFLVQERGHGLLPKDPTITSYDWGFMQFNGLRCQVTRRITDDDWAAINERFVMPDNIGYGDNLIRDNINYIDIEGVERIITVDGPIPVEEYKDYEQKRGGRT
jgi:hypothetical protein